MGIKTWIKSTIRIKRADACSYCLLNNTSYSGILNIFMKEEHTKRNIFADLHIFFSWFRSMRCWANKNCKSFNCTSRKPYWHDIPMEKFMKKTQRQIQSYFPWIRNYVAHGCNCDDESCDRMKMTPTQMTNSLVVSIPCRFCVNSKRNAACERWKAVVYIFPLLFSHWTRQKTFSICQLFISHAWIDMELSLSLYARIFRSTYCITNCTNK